MGALPVADPVQENNIPVRLLDINPKGGYVLDFGGALFYHDALF
jgi:hypothetical protein